MSTVPPDFPRQLDDEAKRAGYTSHDARVLGNPEHARNGELRVMVGGEEAVFQSVLGILESQLHDDSVFDQRSDAHGDDGNTLRRTDPDQQDDDHSRGGLQGWLSTVERRYANLYFPR